MFGNQQFQKVYEHSQPIRNSFSNRVQCKFPNYICSFKSVFADVMKFTDCYTRNTLMFCWFCCLVSGRKVFLHRLGSNHVARVHARLLPSHRLCETVARKTSKQHLSIFSSQIQTVFLLVSSYFGHCVFC